MTKKGGKGKIKEMDRKKIAEEKTAWKTSETGEMTEDYVMIHVCELCKERNWTPYRLAKESGIPHSTLNNMLKRTNTPTFSTLLKLCKGFGITITQFFSDGNCVQLTDEQKQLLRLWSLLEAEEKYLGEAYLRGLAGKRGEEIALTKEDVKKD